MTDTDRRTHVRPLLTVFLGWLWVMAGANLAAPLYAVYADRFGFSGIVLTTVFAMYAVTLVATLLLCGRLADRFGRRPVILAGLLAAGVALVVFALADGTLWLYVARALQGIAVGLISGPATAALVEIDPQRETRRPAMLAGLAQSLGSGSGPVLAGVLAQWAPDPLRLCFLVGIAGTVIAGVFTWTALSREHGDEPWRIQWPRVPAEMRRDFVRLGLTAGLLWASLALYLSVVPSYVAGLLATSNLALLGANSALACFASGAAQIWARRHAGDRRRWQAIGLTVLAAGLVLLVVSSLTHSLATVLIGAVATGLGHGMAFLHAQDELNAVVPGERRAGHRQQVIAARHRLRRQTGQRDLQRVRRRLVAAEIDDEAQILVPVRLAPPGPEARRDVVRRAAALALGVLRGHRRHLARSGQIGYGGSVTAREHLRPARDGEVLVDHQPALARLEPETVDQRVRPDANAPDQRPGRGVRLVGQHDPARPGLVDRRTHPDLDVPLAQHLVGGPRQPYVELGQHPVGDVEQHPAHPLVAQPRSPLLEQLGVEHAVRGDLGAGVPGADDGERAQRLALGRIVGGVGELDLLGEVVAQEHRLGDPAEPVRVLGDTRDREQLVDASGRDHQPVVADLAGPALGIGVPDRARVQIAAVDLAEDQPDVGQRVGDRHRHPARLEDAGGDLGQQRDVEEVVGRVDDDDLGPVACQPAQRLGGVEAGESGADDDDPRSAHTRSVPDPASSKRPHLTPATHASAVRRWAADRCRGARTVGGLPGGQGQQRRVRAAGVEPLAVRLVREGPARAKTACGVARVAVAVSKPVASKAIAPRSATGAEQPCWRPSTNVRARSALTSRPPARKACAATPVVLVFGAVAASPEKLDRPPLGCCLLASQASARFASAYRWVASNACATNAVASVSPTHGGLSKNTGKPPSAQRVPIV